MSCSIKHSNTWKTNPVISAKMNNAWRTVTEVFQKHNNAWRRVHTTFEPLMVSIPSTSSNRGSYATSVQLYADVQGGSGDFTYNWSHVSGAPFSLESQNTSMVTIRSTVEGERTGYFRCTVTDNITGYVYLSNPCQVTLTVYEPGGQDRN